MQSIQGKTRLWGVYVCTPQSVVAFGILWPKLCATLLSVGTPYHLAASSARSGPCHLHSPPRPVHPPDTRLPRECTADDVMRITRGRAIFASGSPQPPVILEGRAMAMAQANNMYIFPGPAPGGGGQGGVVTMTGLHNLQRRCIPERSWGAGSSFR